MNFLYGPNNFIGLYINYENPQKLGHDITKAANPVMTMYPMQYNLEWIEVDVYL